LRFPAKTINQIIEGEIREAGKRLLALERLLDGCTKETLAFFNRTVEFEELGWQAPVCKKGDIPRKVWVVYKGSVAAIDTDVETMKQNGLQMEIEKKQSTSRVVKILGPEICLGLLESKYGRPMKYNIQTYQSNTVIFWVDSANLWEATIKEPLLAKSLKLKGLQFSMCMTKGVNFNRKVSIQIDITDKITQEVIRKQDHSDTPDYQILCFDKTSKIMDEKRVKSKGRGLLVLNKLFGLRKNAIDSSLPITNSKEKVELAHNSYSSQNLAWFANISRRYI
jgi:hypothetical protein